MTVLLVISLIGNVALGAFLAAALFDWTAERRAFTDYRRTSEEAERQRVARRRRLSLPPRDDAGW